MRTKHDTAFMGKAGILILVLAGGNCCIVVGKGVTKENKNLWATIKTIFP